MIRFLTITALAIAMTSMEAQAEADVEVTLSAGLQSLEVRIDSLEQTREKRFRRNRHYDLNATTSIRRFASSRYRDVAWANELLVPELAAYGVKNLISALVNESLNRAGVDPAGMIVRVHLDALRVSGHPLARLSGSQTYARGTISLVDAANGQILRSAEITANTVIDPTVDLGYRGPDFAFEDTDADHRVGPALAFFVMKGLGKLYEGTDFPRPVAVVYAP